MLNGRYGRVQESYLRDLGGSGDTCKQYMRECDLQEHDTETRFPILDKPAKACRGPTRQTCCGADVTKQCGCATCHSCPTTIKIDRRGRPWSTKKMRAGYVRMVNQKACCTTTKDMSCMSSGDYISRLKARKACPCDNPAQKRVCGNSGTGC